MSYDKCRMAPADESKKMRAHVTLAMALAAVGCRPSCEQAIEQRLGVGLPRDAKVESCQHTTTTALQNAFHLTAVFTSTESTSALAERWDMQEHGLSSGTLFLLSHFGEYAPEDVVDADRAKDGAIRLRSRVLSVLRKVGPSRYRLHAQNLNNNDETQPRRR
jgi:hypothetical protein